MVLADGCFDPLHIGHIRYLQAAMRISNVSGKIVVNVAPDSEIIAKGRKPFQTALERQAMLAQGLWMVERTTSGPLLDVLRAERPSCLVKGIDWKGKLPADVIAFCEEIGTAICFVDTLGKSSTERLSA